MIELKGKGVFKGVAIGKLFFLQKKEKSEKAYFVEDPNQEAERFLQAKKEANDQLHGLWEKAQNQVGKEEAMIFEIHQMMLEDPDYWQDIVDTILREHINAEAAVDVTTQKLMAMFEAMEDSYMRQRAADVKDISSRIKGILQNESTKQEALKEPVIIAAEDLAPSETIQLDKANVLGFITMEGSVNSHTAILARTMGIPAVIQVGKELREDYNGKPVVVDGFTGMVYIDPDKQTLEQMKIKKQRQAKEREQLESYIGKESRTKDGRKIEIYANMGNVLDLDFVLQNDAEGIGLFRSEFLYLENNDYPTEEQQFKAYKEAAEKMDGKRLIIRTLDIGADKKAAYFQLPAEENPAMGYRAIRICLTRPEIFRVQLRAILRASAYGKVAVMFPMITSVEEVRMAKKILEEVKESLKNEKIAYEEQMEVGIMLETPAAVLISDLLAEEVDFFSIGTNDLTQYTLAIDRQNQSLAPFYQPHHPAVLRMIQLAVENAHKAGKWIGICGELGADTSLTQWFLDLGVDELSVSPSFILPLRRAVRQIDRTEITKKDTI